MGKISDNPNNEKRIGRDGKFHWYNKGILPENKKFSAHDLNIENDFHQQEDLADSRTKEIISQWDEEDLNEYVRSYDAKYEELEFDVANDYLGDSYSLDYLQRERELAQQSQKEIDTLRKAFEAQRLAHLSKEDQEQAHKHLDRLGDISKRYGEYAKTCEYGMRITSNPLKGESTLEKEARLITEFSQLSPEDLQTNIDENVDCGESSEFYHFYNESIQEPYEFEQEISEQIMEASALRRYLESVGRHNDVSKLNKAITEMKMTRYNVLITIYEEDH